MSAAPARIGLLSDIHGNALALDAVLAACAREAVDQLLVCGDFVGYYYSPSRVLDLLEAWSWHGIRGNHEDLFDDWLAGDEATRTRLRLKYGSGYAAAEESLRPEQRLLLASLPQQRWLELGESRVLLCHGSTWQHDSYVYPDAGPDLKRRMALDGQADLVAFGHTHWPVVWQEGQTIVVNPGSVGQPRDRQPGACWALWDVQRREVSLRRESYDASDLLRECRKRDPALPYLIKSMFE